MNKCIYCGALDLKEEEDRSKPPISFVPRPIYHKKYTCKKCRKSFSKEDMENPPAIPKGAETQPDSSTPSEPAAVAAPAHATKPASTGFSSETYTSPFFSSSPSAAQKPGFATMELETGSKSSQEKKSYMQIMKEKQQYQAQQFQSTVAAEQAAAKPPAKPAPKPGPKPAGGPLMKPAGAKPPAPTPTKPAESLPAELPELEALPDLPPVVPPAPEEIEAAPGAKEAPAISEFSTPPPAPPASAFQTVEAPIQPPAPAIKPAFQTIETTAQPSAPAMKPAGMKPPVKPASGPVMKPVGMKPPVKPASAPVMKPVGMKPPPHAAPASSSFQSIEAPAPKYVPPVPANEPAIQEIPDIQAAGPSPGIRLQELLAALDKVLNSLAWPQEKKEMLKQELVNLPENDQIAFLEQLGVDVPPAPAPVTPVAAAPAPVTPVAAAPAVSAPVVPAPYAPGIGLHPPMKPAGGMKPSVTPPIKPPVAMKPPVSPLAPGTSPARPPMKPAGGIKPPVKPPVAIPAPSLAIPSAIPPPVAAPVSPFAVPGPDVRPPVAPPAKPSTAAVGLFDTIDHEIEQTVGGEFDLDKFLDSGLDLAAPGVPSIPVSAPVTTPKAHVNAVTAAIGKEDEVVSKPAIKLSQISTKVEKKTEEDLKREEERQKAQAATESSLVYMRLLAFEKACSVPKAFKLGDFCKLLKDIDQQTIANFILAVDNDFIIKYDSEKEQVIVSEISGPEMEILSRQFEKWLRFGRL